MDAGRRTGKHTSTKTQACAVTPVQYIPAWGLYAQELCKGVRLHIQDAFELMAVQTGLQVLQNVLQLYPNHVQERLYKTNANPSGKQHLDFLLGIPNAFDQIKKGEPVATGAAQEWRRQIKPYLLYCYAQLYWGAP